MNPTYDSLFLDKEQKTHEQVRLYAKRRTAETLTERRGFPFSAKDIHEFLDLYIINEKRYASLDSADIGIAAYLAIEEKISSYVENRQYSIPPSATSFFLIINEYLYNKIICCYVTAMGKTKEPEVKEVEDYYRKYVHNDNYYLFFRKMREEWLEI